MVKETRYYDVLGVAPNALSNDIKLAYQYQAEKMTHGSEEMEEIDVIYEILKDDDQRQKYNAYGEAREADDDQSKEPYVFEYAEEDRNLDGFDGYHQLEHNLKISFEDTYSGVAKMLRVKRYIKCASCEEGTDYCEECNGKRRYRRIPHVVVFEAGVQSRFQRQYELHGNHGDQQYIPSLLTINVTSTEHAHYKRAGYDLVMQMWFDHREAIVCFDRVFTTIDNRVIRIKKRPGETTHDKEKIVVKREGFRINEKKRGDLIIFCRVNWDDLYTLPASAIDLLKRACPTQPAALITPKERTYRVENLNGATTNWSEKYEQSPVHEKFYREFSRHFPDH